MNQGIAPLRCVSIQQPYAWAVCAGIKSVENRSWKTDHRGLIAIHASTKKQHVTQYTREHKTAKLTSNMFTYSAIIGVAELDDVVEMNIELESNPFASGEQCWLLKNARLLPSPLPSGGKLRLYSLTPEQSEQVRRQLDTPNPIVMNPESQAWHAALLKDGNNSRARANAYLQLAKGDDAIRNFDRAIEQTPEDATLYYCRALVWTWFKENVFKGIADCSKALELDPELADAFLLRSEAYRTLGDEASAKADEQRAERLEPGCLGRWKAENAEGALDEDQDA